MELAPPATINYLLGPSVDYKRDIYTVQGFHYKLPASDIKDSSPVTASLDQFVQVLSQGGTMGITKDNDNNEYR